MHHWLRFFVVALLGLLIGYWIGASTVLGPRNGAPPTEVAENRTETVPEAETPGTLESARTIVRAVDSLPSLPQTLLDNAAGDLDGDGAPERIELYAAVDRDPEGRLMWDDGQRWALIVRDGDLIYHLVNELVQLGKLSFWLVDPMDGDPPAIVVQRATGAGVRVQKYIYDRELRGFVAVAAVEASGNVVHETPPTIGA